VAVVTGGTPPGGGPPEDPEAFYRSFWRTGRWSAAEPNEDERSRLSAILDLLNSCDLPRKPRILDLGCGRGWLARALTPYGDVLGTDIVSGSIDRARELFPDLAFEKTDTQGLLESHGAEAFDLVVSSEVLEHVERRLKPDFLAGLHRLLRPGGWAILTTPRGELWRNWPRGRGWRQPVEDWVSERELDDLAEAAGFRIEGRRRAHVYRLGLVSRVFASGSFRSLDRALPLLGRLSHPWRIYQVVLLRRPDHPMGIW